MIKLARHGKFFTLFMTLAFIFTTTSFAAAPAPAWGSKGAVATAHPLATQAAAKVLGEGGNAFDAALAAIFTLDVVTGYSLGIGGGEFWVIRTAQDDKITTFDGRESAPAAAHRDMYIDPNDSTGAVIPGLSTMGPLAGGTPGSVAVRGVIHEKYGSKSWKRLLSPGIEAADKGFMLTPGQGRVFEASAPYLAMYETSKNIIFKDDSLTWGVGDIFVQKDLANTLKRIAKNGPDEFYEGETALEMVRYLSENGGILTLDDLKNYEVIEREPVSGTYRDYEVYSMAPPSSGGIHIIQMLNMLEEWNLEQFGRYSADYYHHLTEVMKAAFADRSEYLGDPAWVNVPVDGLISKDYADDLRSRIEKMWQVKVHGPGNPMMFMDNPPDSLLKPSHTSHLSVIDKWGNMVAITSSVNTHFGSKVVLGNTGIFFNNTMDDFSIRPGYPNYFGLIGSEANAIAPNKRPLSSMSPTILLKDGKPFMAIGGAGGPKIITGTLQSILNVIDFKTDIQDAISDPRIHHQWSPNYLFIDDLVSPETAKALYDMGHRVLRYPPGSVVQGVMLDPESGLYFGAADPRAGGSAAGIH